MLKRMKFIYGVGGRRMPEKRGKHELKENSYLEVETILKQQKWAPLKEKVSIVSEKEKECRRAF